MSQNGARPPPGKQGRYNRGVSAAHETVKRELLVRLLDSVVSGLHGGFTYAEGYATGRSAGATACPEASAIAALRVLGEFADRLRGPVSVVLVGEDGDRLDALREQLARVLAELPAVSVATVAGDCDSALVPALERADALGAPLFAYLDATGARPPGYETVARVGAGHHADVLVAVDPADPLYSGELRRAGLTRVAHVELVDDDGYAQILLFATGTDTGLDRFKDELWSVDEFAGVRYRDPRDPDHELLDISLEPHLGPLRRALVDRVAATGGCPAGELRDYTRTTTIYRAADALRALTGLVAAGRLSREPERGRLTAKTVIHPSDRGHVDRW
ncbi:hypothetical protein HC028_17715 [Planosporangium flavigriseum]|uniref:Three-Cys-motif partner protein n=1 Tax=Planosporangium flavigriseum TaxID=373681 RepID=A0A8J3LM54_9ACTN|nr:hypothetical protein [Planosporangium flavigriseum]NJC66327.1 hypothetical protein [Planosporangium flavigriseum]GIG75282.1 hypothetical protein Pfl04_36860 [Planosporangium flavigriseum]